MKKLIVIGESRLEVKLSKDGSCGSATAGGVIFNAACKAAELGVETIMISEIGNDPAGDILVDVLANAGVDMSFIDRLASPPTPIAIDVDGRVSRYYLPTDEEGLDIAWPRIERGDVVAFGGYFSLDCRVRSRLWQLLSAAEELGATIVYVPDVVDQRITRMTKVMPQVFENLEIANGVIALKEDLPLLFSTDDGAKAFKNHVSFYCQSLLVVDQSGKTDAFGTSASVTGKNASEAIALALNGLIRS